MRTAAVLPPLLALAACGESAAPEPPAPPPGDLTVLRHDFGVLRHGTEATHDFVVPVDPAEELVPLSFAGDCSCAVGRIVIRGRDGVERHPTGRPVPRYVVGEGETLILRLTLDTSRRPAKDQPVAESRGRLVVQPIDARDPTEQIDIGFSYTFGIDCPVRVTPTPEVDFGALALGRGLTLSLRLQGDGRPVRFGPGAACTLDRVRVDLRPDTGAASGDGPPAFLLEARFAPGEPPATGPFQGTITVPTDLDDGYVLELPVAGEVIPVLQGFPSNILGLGYIDLDTPHEPDDFLTVVDHGAGTGGRPLEVVHVVDHRGRDASEHWAAALEPLPGKPGRHRLTVRYLGGWTEGEFRGEILVAADPGDGPFLEVQLLAFRKHDS